MKTLIIVLALIVAALGAPQNLLTPTIITAQSPVLSQYHSQDTLGQYSYGYNGGSSAKVESKSIDGITRGSYSYVDAEGQLQTVEYMADSVNGFRAAATNLPKASINGISDTPEVAQAKAEHFRAFNEASLRAAAEPENPPQVAEISPAQPQILALPYTSSPGSFSYSFNTPVFGGPQLIAARTLPLNQLAILAENNINNSNNINGPQDTPEVTQAKIEHLKAVEEQKARIAAAQ